MSTPYTEDCISFTGIFGEPVGFPMFTDYRDTPLRLHEHGSGMKAGEIIKDVYGPENYLYLQRDFGARAFYSGHAFVPLDEILQAMTDIYRDNQQRFHEERARIKINIDALECKFVAATMSQPLFLRHPITGTITKHEHPYPAFPTIRLRTADPIIAATKACCQLISYLDDRPDLALLQQLDHEQNYFFRNPPMRWFSRVHHPAAPKPPLISAPPSAIASTLSPSNRVVRPVMLTTTPAGTHRPRLRKRQRETAASKEFGPTKRPRGALCITPRRNPPRAAKTMARRNMAPPARKRRVT